MMIPSETKLDAFGPSCTSLFISQVTTGCDPVFILKALSAFMNRKELILAYTVAMREMLRWLNWVPCVPLISDGPELTR
jgi:hypothetical protein